MKKILIADDHAVVLYAVSKILKNHFTDVSIDYAENYDVAKNKIKNDRYDLVILDIMMQGTTYASMTKELRLIQEDVLILIFTASEDTVALEYIREGADGFLNKTSNPEKLIRAVDSVFKDGYYYPLSAIKEAINSDGKKNNVKSLSKREYEIFELLAQGNGLLEIGNILNINTSTVSTFKRRIYDKLDIKNIVDLAKLYNDFIKNR